MCTLWVLRHRVPGFPVVIAGNRDEMLNRPWSAPRWLPDAPEIWAPRDDREGGTWLGLNRRGVLLALTNRLAIAHASERPSRGLLALQALRAPDAAHAKALVRAEVERAAHNGFNLFLCDRHGVSWLCYGDGVLEERALDGVHVVTSQHDLDPELLAPLTQQVEAAASRATGLSGFAADLRPVLSDHRLLGPRYSVCKHAELYGTRSAAVLALRDDGAVAARFAQGRPCETDFEVALD